MFRTFTTFYLLLYKKLDKYIGECVTKRSESVFARDIQT